MNSKPKMDVGELKMDEWNKFRNLGVRAVLISFNKRFGQVK